MPGGGRGGVDKPGGGRAGVDLPGGKRRGDIDKPGGWRRGDGDGSSAGSCDSCSVARLACACASVSRACTSAARATCCGDVASFVEGANGDPACAIATSARSSAARARAAWSAGVAPSHGCIAARARPNAAAESAKIAFGGGLASDCVVGGGVGPVGTGLATALGDEHGGGDEHGSGRRRAGCGSTRAPGLREMGGSGERGS